MNEQPSTSRCVEAPPLSRLAEDFQASAMEADRLATAAQDLVAQRNNELSMGKGPGPTAADYYRAAVLKTTAMEKWALFNMRSDIDASAQ